MDNASSCCVSYFLSHLHFDVTVVVGSTDAGASVTAAFIVIATSENLPRALAYTIGVSCRARLRHKGGAHIGNGGSSGAPTA